MKLTVNTQEVQERFTTDDVIQIKYQYPNVEFTYAVMHHNGYVMLYNLSNGYSAYSKEKAEDIGELLRAIKNNSNVRGYRILPADEYEMHVVRKGGR